MRKPISKLSGPFEQGFTLVEMIMVMLVSAILVTKSIPAINNYFEKNYLKGAAEILHSRLQQARSESIKRFAPVFVNISAPGGDAWSYGLSDSSNCDSAQNLGAGNDCTLNVSGTPVLHTEKNQSPNSQFSNINLAAYTDLSMSTPANPLEIRFDPVRGTSTGGLLRLTSSSGWAIHATISVLGKVELCSPTGSSHVSGYSPC
ncbi:MAG: GspH/FimT family pseudopilin [Gammaproteobacteria bacterium]|nr:GspH/FimT family pseudopilin [Gammaproteobacteria bacterium]MDH5803253.1 GspH/FimT family pseudopilin [Gammaproteobacteria bacterium]